MSGKPRLLRDDIINQSIKIYGKDQIDYSKMVYIDSKTKCEFRCIKHNIIFTQQVYQHLMHAIGCQECLREKKNQNCHIVSSLKELIFKSESRFGKGTFDYSKVKFIDMKTKIDLICNTCHHTINIQITTHLRKGNCIKCAIHKNRDSTELFIEKIEKKFGKGLFDFSEMIYKNQQTKVKIRCLKHTFFETTPNNFLNGKACLECSKERIFLKNKNNFFEKANNLYGDDAFDYSNTIYIDNLTPIAITCKIHGSFTQTPAHFLAGRQCRFCTATSSKGEDEVKHKLKKNLYLFEEQKKFKKCKNILPLFFDFYLPSYNVCIEYDGKQHFESVSFFGGIDHLERTQKNDNIKNKFCLDNGIKLIRIPYWEINNINTILEDILQNDNFSVCSSNLRNLKQKENNASTNTTRYSSDTHLAS